MKKTVKARKPSVALQPENNGKRPGGITGKGFRPGQSGNPGGKRRGTVSLKAALLRVLSRCDAEQIVRGLVEKALKSDLAAIKLLAELTGDVGPAATATALAVAQGQALVQAPLETLSDAELERIVIEGRKRGFLSGTPPAEGDIPKLSPAELRAIIATLKNDPDIARLEVGTTITKQGYGLEVVPPKPPIDFAKVAAEMRELCGMPQGQAVALPPAEGEQP